MEVLTRVLNVAMTAVIVLLAMTLMSKEVKINIEGARNGKKCGCGSDSSGFEVSCYQGEEKEKIRLREKERNGVINRR